MGNVLAVSQGDNRVSLWKESIDGNLIMSCHDIHQMIPPYI
jgi:hypothetical protein